jgi:surface carbohydrate biosynthesis protein
MINIYFHIDEVSRDSVVASALTQIAKKKKWRIIYGNRNLGFLMAKFERFFDVIILPKPTFLTSFFHPSKIENLRSNYVILYTEQIGIMTSPNFPKLALRQMLDKEFMSGDSKYVNKIAAFCFWSNQAKKIVLDNFPELSQKCYVVGHPRHDSNANPVFIKPLSLRENNIGIVTRFVSLNDYFGRNSLESILENRIFIKKGEIIEYSNPRNGDIFASRIRGVNPKNDISIESIDFENMILIIEALTELGLKISIKKHPKEDLEIYKKVLAQLGTNVSLAPSNIPFAFWIQNQNYVIGPPSTSFYDALMLGVLPISTSEINPHRKSLITDMYEDFNPLMKHVVKPKSINELIDFVKKNDPKVYSDFALNSKVIKILESEVNYPNHINSLSEFCEVIQKILKHRKVSLAKNFMIWLYLIISKIESEFRFIYYSLLERSTRRKILTSAGFVMNFKIRRYISNLSSNLDRTYN